MKYRPYCGADLADGAASFCMERGKSLPTAEGRGIFAVPFGDQRRGAQVYADRCSRRQQNAADHADLRPDERTGEIDDGNAERESGSSPLPEMRRQNKDAGAAAYGAGRFSAVLSEVQIYLCDPFPERKDRRERYARRSDAVRTEMIGSCCVCFWSGRCPAKAAALPEDRG